MPAQFTGVFAERLNRYSTVTVKHAEEGDHLVPDQVLIAPGGTHLVLKGVPPHVRVALCNDPPVSGHRPSVDVLFQSAAQVFQRGAIGFLMTGMGRDGVDGCKAILAAGGLTLGQDEETSAVYGMNKAAYLEGAVKAQFALDELPGIINNIAAFRASLATSAGKERKPSDTALRQGERRTGLIRFRTAQASCAPTVRKVPCWVTLRGAPDQIRVVRTRLESALPKLAKPWFCFPEVVAPSDLKTHEAAIPHRDRCSYCAQLSGRIAHETCFCISVSGDGSCFASSALFAKGWGAAGAEGRGEQSG